MRTHLIRKLTFTSFLIASSILGGASSGFSDDSCGSHRDEKTTCVSNCTSRDINALCTGYGPDYCGVNPSCVSICASRDINALCTEYGPDSCSSN